MTNETWQEMSFGKRLNTLRLDKKLRINKLANALGVKAVTVSRWLKDAQLPDIKHINTLCNVLGCSSDVLFGRIDYLYRKEKGCYE